MPGWKEETDRLDLRQCCDCLVDTNIRAECFYELLFRCSESRVWKIFTIQRFYLALPEMLESYQEHGTPSYLLHSEVSHLSFSTAFSDPQQELFDISISENGRKDKTAVGAV